MVKFPTENSESVLQQFYSYFRNEQKSWILLCPCSIGDTWITCALMKSFREQHGGPIRLIVKQAHEGIAALYTNDVDQMIVSGPGFQEFCYKLERYQRFDMDQPIIVHPGLFGDGRLNLLTGLFAYKGRGGISTIDLYRHILHLNWDLPLHVPAIPEDWTRDGYAYAASLGMVQGKSVVLVPDNNTNPSLPDEFWHKLVAALTRNGMHVFTNTVGGASTPNPRTAFPGTLPITIPLQFAVPITEYAGWIISGSNGLLATIYGLRANARIATLIYKRSGENRVVANGLDWSFPEGYQSLRHGFAEFPVPDNLRDYVVDVDSYTDRLVEQIACHSQEGAYQGI